MDTITATNQIINAPTVNLTAKYKGKWGSDDIVGDMTGGVALRWSSTDAQSCLSGRVGGFSVGNKTSGTDWQIDEPTLNNSITYTITCTGPGGTATDSITVTNQVVDAPTVNLTVKYKGVWGGDDISGDMTEGIALMWSSTGATGCKGNDTGGFSTGGKTGGTDWQIDEPTPNQYHIYTITCTGPGGMAMDSITVANQPNESAVTLEVNHYKIAGGGWGTWGSDAVVLNTGDHIGLRWQGTNVTSCYGSSSDFNVSGVIGNDYEIVEPTKGNNITYTITCAGSSGTVEASIFVNNPITIDLKGAVYKGGQYVQNWHTSDVINIETGQEVALGWSVADATSCSGSGSADFDVHRVSGTDWYITEPTAGNSTTYTVTCQVGDSTIDGSITVNNLR